jgi:hypothetical protein
MRTKRKPPLRIKATLNKSIHVEPVETLPLQINNLRRTSTGSVRTGRLVQHCLNATNPRLPQGAPLSRPRAKSTAC